MPTNINDVNAGLDPSLMSEISGAQLLQLVQELTTSSDRGFIFCTDNLPTVAEITSNPLWKHYLAIKLSDNPKVIYGFDNTKFLANTNPPWTQVSLLSGSVTNSMLFGGIQLSKLSIDPPVPADAGKYVVVNGAGNGYIVQTLNITDGSITLAKLSILGGIEDQFIKIKADLSGYEFVSAVDIAGLFPSGSIAVRKLYTGGTNPNGSSLVVRVAAGESLMTLGLLGPSDINASGIPDGYMLVAKNGQGSWANPIPAGGSYAVVQHILATNTGAGNAPGIDAWFTRVLNNVTSDNNGIILSLGANLVELGAGTYRVRLRVPGYGTVQQACRLYNVTDGAPVSEVVGQNSGSPINDLDSAYAEASGEFIITGTKQFRVEQIVKIIGAGNGLGIPCNFAGRSEVYSQLEIWKIV